MPERLASPHLVLHTIKTAEGLLSLSSKICCMQVKIRLAAAKVKLQQLQSALAAEKSSPGSSNHTNAWQAPGWFLTSTGTQPGAVAHNDIKAQGLHDSSMPGFSILAREPGHSYSHLTSQQLDCRLQDDSKVDGKQMQAANPFLAEEAATGKDLKGPGGGTRRDSTMGAMQDQLADSNAVAEQDGLCEICMESPVETVFQPCLHTIACAKCADKIMAKQNECPMCRTLLQAVLPSPASSQKVL